MNEFIPLRCASCGIEFGMVEGHHDLRKKDGASLYCPNGHSNSFPQKDTVKELKAELAETKKELGETKQLLFEAQVELRRLKCEEMAKNL